jgi:hypothetical protein
VAAEIEYATEMLIFALGDASADEIKMLAAMVGPIVEAARNATNRVV